MSTVRVRGWSGISAGIGAAVRSAPWGLLTDVVITVALIGLAFLPAAARQGANLGELPARPLDALGVVTLLAQCLPILVRRRWPAMCLVIVGVAFAVFQVRGYPETFASVGLPVLLYNAGAHLPRGRIPLAAAAIGGYAVLALALHAARSPERPLDYLTFGLALVVCWGIGAWLRVRELAAAELRRRAEEALVVAERARIARDLHDVVTHHVTAMVVQADAGPLLPEPDATASFTAISDAGRRALTDLRQLLGVLDGTAEPDWTPSSARLPELIEHSRAAGQPVELVVHGQPRPLSAAADAAAYRVVQESLTNALKHAAGQRTVVRVEHGEAWLELAVTTDRARQPGLGRGSGRGLTGLRERIAAVGGELRAGPDPAGTFTVRARLPVATP